MKSFPSAKKIIGIHPFRSDFATSVYNAHHLPAKKLPSGIVNAIISDDYNYLIFGSEKDFSNYDVAKRDNVKLVSCENILHSLCAVKYCSLLIGLDSCFKSMSSMQRINTACIIGDFNDPTRDSYFIDKYVADGVMKVFKTNNESADKEKIIDFLVSEINKVSS